MCKNSDPKFHSPQSPLISPNLHYRVASCTISYKIVSNSQHLLRLRSLRANLLSNGVLYPSDSNPSSITCLFSLWQDESSSSDDEDDGGWGAESVGSGSESSDEGEGKSASLALVFLKKWVSLSDLFILCLRLKESSLRILSKCNTRIHKLRALFSYVAIAQ